MTKYVTGEIVENLHWNDRLFTIKVAADVADFRAGQFTNLALQIDDEIIARPYSYVNAPQVQPLEFHAAQLPGGTLSQRLYEIGVGDHLLVSPQSFGFLTLEEVPDREILWLLSTGTAIGPFISILRAGILWQRFDQVVLAHGVRFAADLTYADTINSIRTQYPSRLHYVPFITREQRPDVIVGRIPAAIESLTLEEHIGLAMNTDNSHIMICGNPPMVNDTLAALKARGFRLHRKREPGQITLEKYG